MTGCNEGGGVCLLGFLMIFVRRFVALFLHSCSSSRRFVLCCLILVQHACSNF